MTTPVSSFTETFDIIFLALVIFAVVTLLLITAIMIYFVVRYNRKRHPRAEPIHGNTTLEIIWTVIPLLIVTGMFYYGYEGFRYLREVPEDAFTINVVGRMWDWTFEYENGRKSDKLYVPVDRNVKLSMTSLDVNHSFFIPAFRVKEDVVPGRTTYLWFKPQTVGPADVFCAEYCGQRHAYMLSEVVVMEKDAFDSWYGGEADSSPAAAVETAAAPVEETTGFTEEQRERARKVLWDNGCFSCHTTDGSENLGPSLKGLFQKDRYVLVDGQERVITADEAYLRRAIVDPDAEYVKGYDGVIMPPADDLSPSELTLIIDYIQSLK
ncbi:MAG: cytochrome c oxidase subunit II [Acidobacteria bacterium]|nr:cytochrome c oxidase subunit II [Acidobacteriota bacterium]